MADNHQPDRQLLEVRLRIQLSWWEMPGDKVKGNRYWRRSNEFVRQHRFPLGTPLAPGVRILVPPLDLTDSAEPVYDEPLELVITTVVIAFDSGRTEVRTTIFDDLPAPSELVASRVGALLRGFGFKSVSKTEQVSPSRDEFAAPQDESL